MQPADNSTKSEGKRHRPKSGYGNRGHQYSQHFQPPAIDSQDEPGQKAQPPKPTKG